MKKNIYLLAAAAAVLMISCAKETNAPDEVLEPSEGGTLVSNFTILAKAPETKTSFSGGTITWSEGDAIGVFAGDNVNVKFTLSGEGGSASGTFTGTLANVSDGTPLYAYYPYSEGQTDKTAIAIDLSEQDYSDAKSFGSGSYAAASGTVSEGSVSLAFATVLPVVAVQVTNNSSLSAAKVSSVKLVSTSSLITKATVDITAASPAATPVTGTSQEAVMTLNAGTGLSINAGETATYPMSIVPQTLPAGFKVVATTDYGEGFEVEKTSAKSFEKGKYYNTAVAVQAPGDIKQIWSTSYDTDGTVLWGSPAVSPNGQYVYGMDSNWKICQFKTSDGTLNWTYDAHAEHQTVAAGGNVIPTPAVWTDGSIYALVGRTTYGGEVKLYADGEIGWFITAQAAANNGTHGTTSYEFNFQAPILYNGGRSSFMVGGGSKYFCSVNASGGRQTSKGITSNIGGVMRWESGGTYFWGTEMTSSSLGARVYTSSTSGGSIGGGSSTAAQELGYVPSKSACVNCRGSQMSQNDNYVFVMGWNIDEDSYSNGETLLFRYSKSNIKASSNISADYIISLAGGVSKTSSSGMRGVGSVFSKDGSVLYVTTCATDASNGYVHAVNVSDGSVKWSHEARDIYGVAAVDDLGYVYFNDSNTGKLVQLNPATGNELQSIAIPGGVHSSPTVGANGMIFCNALDADGKPAVFGFKIYGSEGAAEGWTQLGGNPQKSGSAYSK